MELLVFIVVILIFGAVLLLIFIGGLITLFSDRQTAIASEQVEVTTVNQFENAVPKRPDVSQ
jgi:Sec-independent protein translocase protein TatA